TRLKSVCNTSTPKPRWSRNTPLSCAVFSWAKCGSSRTGRLKGHWTRTPCFSPRATTLRWDMTLSKSGSC
ncbi:hypothetical protein CPB97_005626, partial [Podila verticillata]